MNGQAGKGSKPRPFSVPLDTYGDRFDAIDWSKGRPSGMQPKSTEVEWIIPDLKDILGPDSPHLEDSAGRTLP